MGYTYGATWDRGAGDLLGGHQPGTPQPHHGRGRWLWRHDWDGCKSFAKRRMDESASREVCEAEFHWVGTYHCGYRTHSSSLHLLLSKGKAWFQEAVPFLKSPLLLPRLSITRSNTRTGKEEKSVPTTNLEVYAPSITKRTQPFTI